MYELYVSLRTFLFFFLSSPPAAVLDVFLAAFSLGVVFAGALEAVEEAGAFPAVDAG